MKGIVESYRGLTGGYELRKENVDPYEIIKALQEDLYITNDFKEKEPEDKIKQGLKKFYLKTFKSLT